MPHADPHQPSTDDDDGSLAAAVRHIGAQIEKRFPPSLPHTPEPSVNKPPALVGAEADVFRCEIAMRLRRLSCADTANCRNRECRRKKRCRELDEIQALMNNALARAARERAKWQAPANKKGASKRAQSVRNRP